MQKHQHIEPLLMKAWDKALKEGDALAISNLRHIAAKRPNVPEHMKTWLSEYTN